ncbi:MAG: hypothetical protein OZSIB_3908 [Candidatus Ozemobacter sibiricus]|uniref:Uncharacterized protein n=1 Tax=Candidatus Ozemobacter sibiricus TaxID=2268124 RepID=A0A367ZNQ1_9BACT|nr:MAG: hypothetical protein OZSIB_3908 [Candidatus Ozemobacter sibiricus]
MWARPDRGGRPGPRWEAAVAKLDRRLLFICLLAWLVVGPVARAAAIMVRAQPGDPEVRAILFHERDARAWIYYQGQRLHVIPKMRIDAEWKVEEIRRESVLFYRSSTHSFIEMTLALPRQARRHRGYSFFGHPIGLWEALELVSRGFGFHAVMHFQAGGTVVPCHHAESLERMLLKILPPHHRFALAGPVLLVLPVRPAAEPWTEVLARMRKTDPEALTIRFPGLKKPGSLVSRGDDIQFVLRQIALGGETPLQFPKDLHFPVYASFKDVPFCQILTKVVYLNQCFLIEREDGLEIQPFPRQIQPVLTPPVPDLLQAGPQEPQMGWGPQPPLPTDPEAAGWERLPPGPPAIGPVPPGQQRDSE